jgi:hypothetical protein
MTGRGSRPGIHTTPRVIRDLIVNYRQKIEAPRRAEDWTEFNLDGL